MNCRMPVNKISFIHLIPLIKGICQQSARIICQILNPHDKKYHAEYCQSKLPVFLSWLFSDFNSDLLNPAACQMHTDINYDQPYRCRP